MKSAEKGARLYAPAFSTFRRTEIIDEPFPRARNRANEGPARHSRIPNFVPATPSRSTSRWSTSPMTRRPSRTRRANACRPSKASASPARAQGLNESFTVRKISYGEGVERVFPVYSPLVDSVDGGAQGQGPPRQALLSARPHRQVRPHRRADGNAARGRRPPIGFLPRIAKPRNYHAACFLSRALFQVFHHKCQKAPIFRGFFAFGPSCTLQKMP